MAKSDFTFDEIIYNSVLSGVQMYYDGDGNETETLVTIDFVKVIKQTRQFHVHCTDGTVFLANQDDVFTFEVTTPKISLPVTTRKQMGKGKKSN